MVDSIQAECIRLAQLGLACLWLRKKDKIPIARGWSALPWQSPSELRRSYRSGQNFGIHTGKVRGARFSVCVVDLDSEDALRWAKKNLPISSVRTRTRNGEHWYYAASEGGVTRAKIRVDSERLALDVRGEGGQTVAPPSVHPTGFVYERIGEWTGEDFANLPIYRPEWFPRALAVAASRSPMLITSDLAMRRGAGLLKRMVQKGEVYSRGEGQGTKTFTAARILINEFGLTDGEVFDLLAEHYNVYCPQPYSADELRRKVREAREKGRSVVTHYGGALRHG